MAPNDALSNGQCPAEAFMGCRLLTTMDLLMPPSTISIDRDEGRLFNRRFGTRPRTFQVDEKVFARHDLVQNWRAGRVTRCTEVIYDVCFHDRTGSRFHANQLRTRHTKEKDEEPLVILNEAFNLPAPPVAKMYVPAIDPAHGEIPAESALQKAAKVRPPESCPALSRTQSSASKIAIP